MLSKIADAWARGLHTGTLDIYRQYRDLKAEMF
jgi:hypothetical protein